MKFRKSWLISLAVATVLGLGMSACDNGDSDKDDAQVNDDGGNGGGNGGGGNGGQGNQDGKDAYGVSACADEDACNTLWNSAKDKLGSCDFAEAFEAVDGVYLKQVADNNVSADVALTRAFTGLIRLLYTEKAQALMPKLGFNSASVDFKPAWKTGNLFNEIHEATHDYEAAWNALPHKVKTSNDVSFMDVLADEKPLIEGIAESLEKAAAAVASKNEPVVMGDAKCGVEKFKFDAADLYMMAAFFRFIDSAINLAAKYDFNFKISDYYSMMGDGYETTDWDNVNQTIVVNQEACTARTNFAAMINEHLYKQTKSTRKVSGDNGKEAFIKAANLVIAAMDANKAGNFFNFEALKAGAKGDIKGIAQKIADGSGDISNYVQVVKVDLDKAFVNVPYRTAVIEALECEEDGWDRGEILTGENDFPYLEYLKHVTGKDILDKRALGHDTYEEYDLNDSIDFKFSSAWDDSDIFEFLDPHKYLGLFWEDEECEDCGGLMMYLGGFFTINPEEMFITSSETTKTQEIALKFTDDDDNPIPDATVLVVGLNEHCMINGKQDNFDLTLDNQGQGSVTLEVTNENGEVGELCWLRFDARMDVEEGYYLDGMNFVVTVRDERYYIETDPADSFVFDNSMSQTIKATLKNSLGEGVGNAQMEISVSDEDCTVEGFDGDGTQGIMTTNGDGYVEFTVNSVEPGNDCTITVSSNGATESIIGYYSE